MADSKTLMLFMQVVSYLRYSFTVLTDVHTGVFWLTSRILNL